jgi:hypothetical protein
MTSRPHIVGSDAEREVVADTTAPRQTTSDARENSWTALSVDANGTEWRHLLEATDHMVFHEPTWARVTERGFGAESCAVVFARDGVVRGGLLGFAFRTLWAKLLYVSFPYGGVIGDAPSGADLSRILRDVARRLGVSRIRITDCPGLLATEIEGVDRVELRTHLLDLSCGDYEVLWSGFKSRIRRDVRKAERAGVTVSHGTDAGHLSAFYSLYLASMKRNAALAKYSPELVNAMVEELGPTDRCAVLLARREGEPIAGILVVDSASMSHYLMGGSTTAGLAHCPNDLLLHTAIRRAVDKRLGAFDFLPSGSDDPALEQFKAKWGATPQPLFVHTVTTHPYRMACWDAAYHLASSPTGSALVRAIRRR